LHSHFIYDVEQMATRNEFLLGTLEQIVLLAAMRLGDRAYGMTVRDEIKKRTGRAVSFGAVYVTLQRLEDKGLVSSRFGEPTAERGGRAKRFFQVTANGRQAVRRVQDAVASMSKGLREVRGST
jgi:DNA-binding PadR family transcriptional regulator